MKIPRFNFHRGTDYLLVFKDHELQLKIKSERPIEIEKYLRNLLPNDYMEWLETYNLKGDFHLAGYIINLCCIDRDVANMFSKVIVKPVLKKGEIYEQV